MISKNAYDVFAIYCIHLYLEFDLDLQSLIREKQSTDLTFVFLFQNAVYFVILHTQRVVEGLIFLICQSVSWSVLFFGLRNPSRFITISYVHYMQHGLCKHETIFGMLTCNLFMLTCKTFMLKYSII